MFIYHSSHQTSVFTHHQIDQSYIHYDKNKKKKFNSGDIPLRKMSLSLSKCVISSKKGRTVEELAQIALCVE
jgi:hypothetical protein